jgi:hypothetical protein
MQRLRGSWLALLFVWPLASQAADVDVPELGIRLTTMPPAASKPQVEEQAGGYQAETRLGSALLSIYRQDNPVPAGSDVAEPNYRAMLDARFGNVVESKTEGAPTAVGGHSAWTVVDARESRGSQQTDYICVTYVIVDDHLYRLTVTAHASAGRPPEFDSLVKAMSGVAFEQVRRANHG